MTLLPREHGAYGQMVLPLVTAMAVADLTGAAALVALSVIAGFLAHEPLIIMLGRRGPRVSREYGRSAALWLALAGLTALASGLAAFWMVPHDARWAFMFPLVPATLLGLAIAAKREKSWQGEVLVAVTFSFVAVPTALAAGAPPKTALAIGMAFAVVFVAATLAVRLVILEVRGGGNIRVAKATRRGLLGVVVVGAAGLSLGTTVLELSWIALFATAPGLVLAAAVARRPPPAARLRTLGWTLVAASSATALVLLVGLRST